MAGFPIEGKHFEIGQAWKQLAGPVSLSSCFDLQPGPGPQQVSRRNNIFPIHRKDLEKHSHAVRVPRVQAKRKNRNSPPRPCLEFPASCPHLARGRRDGACHDCFETTQPLYEPSCDSACAPKLP
jgi:hypothetical protein